MSEVLTSPGLEVLDTDVDVTNEMLLDTITYGDEFMRRVNPVEIVGNRG